MSPGATAKYFKTAKKLGNKWTKYYSKYKNVDDLIMEGKLEQFSKGKIQSFVTISRKIRYVCLVTLRKTR